MKTNFSLLSQPIMKNSYKVDLVTKMLNHVPDLGWTWDALSEAALNSKKMKSHSEEELQTLFDNKIANIIGTFNHKLDEENSGDLPESLKPENIGVASILLVNEHMEPIASGGIDQNGKFPTGNYSSDNIDMVLLSFTE